MEKPKWLIKNGIRLDGRRPEDGRPIKMITGFLERADGSVYLECGSTKVIAAVYGPREMHPKHDVQNDRAVVRCHYDMLPFSVDGERKRPGPDRRSREISKVCSEALTAAVFTERFPKTAIDVFVSVIQADASTRVSGLTAASVALADAGIPMRDLVASCSFGKIYGENGEEVIALDMNKPEDNFGDADCAVAYMPNLKQVVLLQMDGNLTPQEFLHGSKMAIAWCEKIHKLQKDALRSRFV